MHEPREDYGVPELLDVRRRVDWVEPPAHGEYLLVTAPAGDKEDQ